ncbi:MAG: hypothetical protein R3330_18755, partial [Saprospiraceae bacterium]|nr:hypothetical protein [Saprospiraceae bacterium]
AMNIGDMTGQVYVHGRIQTDPDSLEHYLERGYRMWINDSYWLVMPFKLRDPGTQLHYLGTGETMDAQPAEILELTFSGVGVTPDNKYHIYVDPDRRLVVQWDYYRTAEDPEPRIRNLWTNYRRYGKVLLSDGRGDRSLSGLAVHDQLPARLFETVEKTAAELLR